MPPGTGAIHGRVVDGVAPVGRALVTLSTSGGVQSRSTITDGEGRFMFDRLPAGRFTISASKPAYITSAFGATRPGRPGTPISLADNRRLDDISVTLSKGGVIAGTITDSHGDPVPGLLVGYLRASGTQAASGESYRSDWTTDDLGAFRIYGLEPGSYFIVAGWRTSPSTIPVAALQVGEVDAALTDLARRNGTGRGGSPRVPARELVQYVGEYYPGTADIGQAIPIAVAVGDVRTDANFVFTPVPSASIEGVVTSSTGSLPPLVMSLSPAVPSRLPPFLAVSPNLIVRPGSDGTFRYTGVAPGRYLLVARNQPSPGSANVQITTTLPSGGATTTRPMPGTVTIGASTDALYASLELTISGTNLTGQNLDLRPVPRVQGRIEFDAATLAPPADSTRIRVSLDASTSRTFTGTIPGGGTGVMSFNGRETVPNAYADPAGRFEIAGAIPDVYAVSATVPGQSGWRLRSAVIDGRDALDVGLTVRDTPSGELVLTFTDRHNELSGMLQTPAGSPATDYFVVVFTTDRTMWKPKTRRLVFTRPANDGQFSLEDLPAGEYYLAALTDLDPADWQTPEFLDAVVPVALKLTIGEGERKRQDLRLAQ
jgi:hypothetical protein